MCSLSLNPVYWVNKMVEEAIDLQEHNELEQSEEESAEVLRWNDYH